ncbi:STAS domain-containing protein [Streptomyces sp. TP-A0874]|uniref:STAS domain-containing protein n=1 Tax=Streptomyces sp. TP-A0874 TaxID=549819 RepID=UPI000D1B25B9|nr:STAS domain-containing protein [Streptomyces sp. TP-A0874]
MSPRPPVAPTAATPAPLPDPPEGGRHGARGRSAVRHGRPHTGPRDLSGVRTAAQGTGAASAGPDRPGEQVVRVRREAGRTVLEVHGEVDIASGLRLLPHLDAATDTDRPRLVIDLSRVTFLDARGLSLLARADQRVRGRQGSLRVVCTHPLTLRILRLTGLHGRLRPVATLAEALGE